MFKNLTDIHHENLDKLINNLSQMKISKLYFSNLNNPKKEIEKMLLFIHEIKDKDYFYKISKKRTFNNKNEKLLFLSNDIKDIPKLDNIKKKTKEWLNINYIRLLAEAFRNDKKNASKYGDFKNISDQDLVDLVSFSENNFNIIPYDYFESDYNILNLITKGDGKISEKIEESTAFFHSLDSIYNKKSPLNQLMNQCPNYLISEENEDILKIINLFKTNNLKIKYLKSKNDFITFSNTVEKIKNKIESNETIMFHKDVSKSKTFKQKLFLINFSQYSLNEILSIEQYFFTSLLFSQINRKFDISIILNLNSETYNSLSIGELEKIDSVNSKVLIHFIHNSHSKITNDLYK